ncbi:Substance-K receptor [Trichoplax sp. H2]|nr:Substance-K receptor [Trichoplax sp. H2]|eukprot:RDD36121.1 Substance-K receptor [Trichoplax sp. H2]
MESLNGSKEDVSKIINYTNPTLDTNLLSRAGPAVFIFVAFGIIPNIIIVAGTQLKKSLRKKTYYFIRNLACCDLLLALSKISTIITSITANRSPIPYHTFNMICKFLIVFPTYWSYTASVQTLVIISIERYRAIYRPTKKVTPKKAKLLCALAWLVSLLISLPFLFSATSVQNQCAQFPSQSRWAIIVNVILIIFQFVIPMIVMITAYILIFRKLRITTTSITRESANSRNLKRKTTSMLLATTVTFLLCALPWTLMLLLEAFTGKFASQLFYDLGNPGQRAIAILGMISMPISTVYNSVIYCIFNTEIRGLLFPCYSPSKINAIAMPSEFLSGEKNNNRDNNMVTLSLQNNCKKGSSSLTLIT